MYFRGLKFDTANKNFVVRIENEFGSYLKKVGYGKLNTVTKICRMLNPNINELKIECQE